MDNNKEQEDVAFNTFIGVLVSVCGNVGLKNSLNRQKYYTYIYYYIRH